MKKKILAVILCILMISVGVGVGYFFGTKSNESQTTEPTGYAANSAYEYRTIAKLRNILGGM